MKYILPSDDEIRRQIVGTWIIADGADVWTLSPDGSFDEKWASKSRALTFQGTWQITAGFLDATITNRSSVGVTNVAPVGTSVRSRIDYLDATYMTLEFEDQTNKWERKP